MSGTQRIIAIIEPELDPREVVAKASWLAGLTGSSLDLLLCDPEIGPLKDQWYISSEAEEIGKLIREAQASMLDDLAAEPREQGIDVTTHVFEERPLAEALIDHIRDAEPLYVVKGTHFHSAAERAFFVDTDWRLVRNCSAPLYLVKNAGMPESPVIMAAVDPMHAHDKPAAIDRLIISAAQDIAAKTGGDVHLVHTYHKLVGIGSEATRTFKPVKLPIDELENKIRDEHRARLDELARDTGVPKDRVHQLPGRASELLPTFARTHGVNLVVMGGLARWGLKRAVIGSTTERVLDHLPCDVLVVRPDR